MYVILVSMALALYTIVLVDFSNLHQDISLQSDLISSAQAFYAAEGGVEMALSQVGDQDLSEANLVFKTLVSDREFQMNQGSLTYNQGASIALEKKALTLNDGQLFLDQIEPAFWGEEPVSARGFPIREIDPESNFNEIHFNFNGFEKISEVAMDIFEFPREGDALELPSFEALRGEGIESSIKRLSINTNDPNSSGMALGQTLSLSVSVNDNPSDFKKRISIAGFQPLKKNYLIYFQTLDNKPVDFSVQAYYQNKIVALPGMFQTLNVIASTPTGLFQRVMFQRESEELLIPGLNFVHFSDQSISK